MEINSCKQKIKCLICGKIFIDWKLSKRKFCSRKCYYKSYGILKRRKRDKKAEKNSRWNGGKSRGYILRIAREELIKNNVNLSKCKRCSKKSKLVVHHKDRDITNNHYKNLEVLCKSCHMFEHEENKRDVKQCCKCGKFIKNSDRKYCDKCKNKVKW